MARVHVGMASFNRGEVSKHALARVDLERLRLSAEEQVNFMPYALGPMTLRPGTQYIGATAGNQPARLVPFIFSNDDTALIELTNQKARIWLDDQVLTRPSVSTTVNNGNFSGVNEPTFTSATRIGDMTANGGIAAAFDGNTSQAMAACASKTSTADAYIGVNMTGTPKRFSSATIYGSTTNGFVNGSNPTVTLRIYGKNGGAPANSGDGTLLGSVSFTELDDESGGRLVTSTDITTAWDYIWLRVTHDTTNNTVNVAELVLREPRWQLKATAGCTTSLAGNKLTLTATARGGLCTAINQVTVASPGVEHAFRIVVERGPVIFKAGSAYEGSDIISRTTLDTGEHSLACTPGAGSIFLHFESSEHRDVIVTSIAVEPAGVVELPTPWTTGLLPLVRSDQSGDIIFCACYSLQQRKIERRATRSWSIVKYQSLDGPFKAVAGGKFKLTPGAHYGNTTLTSERPYFTASHVGCLFRLFNQGQTREAMIGAGDAYSEPIRVTGSGNQRNFSWTRAGTWAGTLRLQRSFDGEDSGYVDYTNAAGSATSNGSSDVSDGLDNSIVWYRVGFKAGEYTSGAATVAFTFKGGGDYGICRVTGFTSSTSVNVEVLEDFSSIAGTYDWLEGEWSQNGTWPSAVRNHDGRLWWAGGDKLWGSASDSYYSFAIDDEGDDVAINRSVGFGPVDIINDLVSVARLIALREGSELSIRSSSLDEPITPTNFTLKDCSTQGSDNLPGVKIDTNVIFVQRGERRVFELTFAADRLDYMSHDLTRLNLDIGKESFTDVAVSRQPDTNVHLPRGDGRMAELLYEREDQVEAWWRIEPAPTSGGGSFIENVMILPGELEDRIYVVTKRIVGGSTKRYIEKFARRDQCLGQPEARLSDSHVYYSGAAVTTITGLSHLEGETVCVWGWNTSSPFTATLPDGTVVTIGKDLGTYTVSSGQITGLSASVTHACVGLAYEGRFKSAKLAYGGMLGTAINQKKKIDHLGLVLLDTHYQGLRYGQDYAHLDALPLVEQGATVAAHSIWPAYDEPMFSLNGKWDADSRLCLKAASPRPCTVAGVAFAITTNESP